MINQLTNFDKLGKIGSDDFLSVTKTILDCLSTIPIFNETNWEFIDQSGNDNNIEIIKTPVLLQATGGSINTNLYGNLDNGLHLKFLLRFRNNSAFTYLITCGASNATKKGFYFYVYYPTRSLGFYTCDGTTRLTIPISTILVDNTDYIITVDWDGITGHEITFNINGAITTSSNTIAWTGNSYGLLTINTSIMDLFYTKLTGIFEYYCSQQSSTGLHNYLNTTNGVITNNTYGVLESLFEPYTYTLGCTIYYLTATPTTIYVLIGEHDTITNYTKIGYFPAGSGVISYLSNTYKFPPNSFIAAIEELITAGIYTDGVANEITGDVVCSIVKNLNSYLNITKTTTIVSRLIVYNRKKTIYDVMADYFALPTVQLMVGSDITIFGDALINIPIDNSLNVSYNQNLGTEIDNDLHIVATSEMIGLHTVVATFINNKEKAVETINFNVSAQNNLSDKKILLIGDSTLANGVSYIVTELNNRLNATLTCVGTQGSTIKHEGRPGWTTASFIGASSPFYKNGSIDIAAYFADNSIAVPDLINIRLGVNDAWAYCTAVMPESGLNAIINNLKTLIDAFLAYNSTYKIIVSFPLISENSGDGWNANYDESVYIQDYHIKNIHRIDVGIYNQFNEYNSRVSLNCEVIIVDRDTDYPKTDGIHNNGLHPSVTGYTKIGIQLSNHINVLI
jgi:hypothetical protein